MREIWGKTPLRHDQHAKFNLFFSSFITDHPEIMACLAHL